MAAAIVPLIPLILGLEPAIVNLVAGLAHHQAPIVEAANGPGTGPTKFGDLFVGVMKSLTNAKEAGQIATIPDVSAVKLILQSVVQAMKLSGTLGEAPAPTAAAPTPVISPPAPHTGSTAPAPSPQPGLILRLGQSVTITVG
jgi:hypothetical protein